MNYRTQETAETLARAFTLVKRASGDPITSGTANYYLKALTGAQLGKWWKDSDQTWAAVETANTMTHVADGHWTRTLAATPWYDGALFMEYAKESGDLHVPVGRCLSTEYTPSADSSRHVVVTASSSITLTSPVSSSGTSIVLVQGDDYANADGRALAFSVPASELPSLAGVGAAVTMTIKRGSVVVLTLTGTITGAATDPRTFYFELTSAQTGAMPVAVAYNFDVQATLTTGGRKITPIIGTLTVTAQVTP